MATDYTKLNIGTTGDNISTEDLADNAGRGVPNLPEDDYKLPRSKVVVGPYGRDDGDATHDTPLPVESRDARWATERATLAAAQSAQASLVRRHGERVPLVDRRGNGGWRGTSR